MLSVFQSTLSPTKSLRCGIVRLMFCLGVGNITRASIFGQPGASWQRCLVVGPCSLEQETRTSFRRSSALWEHHQRGRGQEYQPSPSTNPISQSTSHKICDTFFHRWIHSHCSSSCLCSCYVQMVVSALLMLSNILTSMTYQRCRTSKPDLLNNSNSSNSSKDSTHR